MKVFIEVQEDKAKPRFVIVRKVVKIFTDVIDGLASIPFPQSTPKPKWCQCAKCGRWHHLGE